MAFDVHTMLYAAVLVRLGYQAIAFAVFTKLFAISEGLLPPDPSLDRLFRYITLAVGLATGGLLTVAGLATSIYAVGTWGSKHFGGLDYPAHDAHRYSRGAVSDTGSADDPVELFRECSGYAAAVKRCGASLLIGGPHLW